MHEFGAFESKISRFDLLPSSFKGVLYVAR